MTNETNQVGNINRQRLQAFLTDPLTGLYILERKDQMLVDLLDAKDKLSVEYRKVIEQLQTKGKELIKASKGLQCAPLGGNIEENIRLNGAIKDFNAVIEEFRRTK